MSGDLRHRIDQLRLPVVAAPMFLISGPELVISLCRAGVGAAFPATNARTIDHLDRWLRDIRLALADHDEQEALWAMNVITHSSYSRLPAELDLIRRHRPPVVITALGDPSKVVPDVHAYGGQVLADVSTPELARRSIDAGVDGLVLVCAGSGGHTGTYTPLALVPHVRTFWDGPLLVGGGIASGAAIAAVRALGADASYVGTAFIPAVESLASQPYRAMLAHGVMSDLVTSSAVTGVPANWLRKSLIAHGYDPAAVGTPDFTAATNGTKAWRDLWSAGHGIDAVQAEEPAARIVDRLTTEYHLIASPAHELSTHGGTR